MDKRVSILVSFFIALLSFGCVPEGTRDLLPVEEVIVDDFVCRWNVWASEQPEQSGYELVSDKCYGELMGVGIYVAQTQEDFHAATGACAARDGDFDLNGQCTGEQLWGQARYGYVDRHRFIVLAGNADWCTTLPHELMHMLALCMFNGDADVNHEREFWAGLGIEPGEHGRPQGPLDPDFQGCE